jgi:small subunit ribosomal protein S7e
VGRERNLIDMLNSEGSTNPYRPKFDPEDPTGKTLVMSVSFFYLEHATSDSVRKFVDGTTFGAHLAVMFPRPAPGSEWQRWDMEGKYVDGGW